MKTATNELELGPDATISLSGSVPLSPSQRKQLLDMLIDNVTVFAEHPSRTPTTTLARHRIDTGSERPVHVPPYRVGPADQQEIDRQVQEMLASGVIRRPNLLIPRLFCSSGRPMAHGGSVWISAS